MRETRHPTERRLSPGERALTLAMLPVAVFLVLVAASAPLIAGSALGAGLLVAGTTRAAVSIGRHGAVRVCVPKTDVCVRTAGVAG